VSEYSSVWPEICRVLSQIQCRFLCGISEKNNFGRIFQKSCVNQGILYKNLWNFALLSEILFWVRIALKKFRQVLSYVVCTQVRRHVHKQIKKTRYGGENPGGFFFWKTSFVHSRSGNYYALLLGYFRLKFLPDFRHCVYWVLDEIWAPSSSHRIGNKFFLSSLPGPKGRFVCVWNSLIFFVGEYSSVWPEICRVLSQIQCRFRKKLFRENFSEILCKPRLSSTKTCEILPYFLKFYSGSVLRWKNSDKYFHMLFAPR